MSIRVTKSSGDFVALQPSMVSLSTREALNEKRNSFAGYILLARAAYQVLDGRGLACKNLERVTSLEEKLLPVA